MLVLSAYILLLFAANSHAQSTADSGWAISQTTDASQVNENAQEVRSVNDSVQQSEIVNALTPDEPAIETSIIEESPQTSQELEIQLETDTSIAVVNQPSSRDISAELKANLEAQFERINELEKTEFAFNSKLGEEYLNYGLLLYRAGRIDEARDAIIDAWHIVKVNEGVYSIRQRPMLRALFDINLLRNKSQALEENFEKLVWIENKNPKERGVFSLDLAIKLGHHFLDLYTVRGLRDEVSLSHLDSAARYFSYAVRQYGDVKMDQHTLPYGELSLVHFYRSRLLERLRVSQRDHRFSRQETRFSR
ncbi:MAG: hypothetical protein KTR16_11220, partial [Acidiferrobacterales bacterium]|nr:hypothetical protein [Acidiferrobacterales bacterium]